MFDDIKAKAYEYLQNRNVVAGAAFVVGFVLGALVA